jgi:hypothetical protein
MISAAILGCRRPRIVQMNSGKCKKHPFLGAGLLRRADAGRGDIQLAGVGVEQLELAAQTNTQTA